MAMNRLAKVLIGVMSLFGARVALAQSAAEPPPAQGQVQPAPGAAVTAAPAAPVDCSQVRVHFAFDKADLTPDAKTLLNKSAHCLTCTKGVHVTIVGNTDKIGSHEYNLKLGERRARAVAQYLESRGVPDDRISTSSAGKTDPICPGADAKCRAVNRRARITPIQATAQQPRTTM
jgi:peptidoglycan-associated lipoprotein